MHPPFQRILSQNRNQPKAQVTALMLTAVFKTLKKRTRFLPEKAIVEVNGSKMLVLPRKGGIDTELYLHKKREIICTEYLRNSGILRAGDTVLDIGANIGYYALLEAQLVGPTGKVYAVEPVKGTFQSLKTNINLNQRQNIVPSRLAFGDKVYAGKIYVSDASNLSAAKKEFVGGKIVDQQDVSFLTVDAFLRDKSYPKLLRMDVEGYEYEIIKGMTQTLKGGIRILVELHTEYLQSKLDELLNILAQHKYWARFVVFEGKVKQDLVMRTLIRKGGDHTPMVMKNLSLPQLRKTVTAYANFSPNVIFEKIAT